MIIKPSPVLETAFHSEDILIYPLLAFLHYSIIFWFIPLDSEGGPPSFLSEVSPLGVFEFDGPSVNLMLRAIGVFGLYFPWKLPSL